jgi:hypothetical protein
MEPLLSHRFPAPMMIKAGDTVQCNFTISMDMGNVRIEEAVLLGSVESRSSSAQRLAHIIDSLNHFRERDLRPDGDCDPLAHVDRAIRELAHALLALSGAED